MEDGGVPKPPQRHQNPGRRGVSESSEFTQTLGGSYPLATTAMTVDNDGTSDTTTEEKTSLDGPKVPHLEGDARTKDREDGIAGATTALGNIIPMMPGSPMHWQNMI